MRIQTTLLALSLAGLSPLCAQNAESPEQGKAERALQEKVKELQKGKPAKMPARTAPASSSYSEAAPESIPQTEDQNRALEALKKKQAELDGDRPQLRTPPPAKALPPMAPPAAPEKPLKARKPVVVERAEPNYTTADPVIIPADSEAQAKALEALKQKTAELDAQTRGNARPAMVEKPFRAAPAFTGDSEAQTRAAEALRQRQTELPANATPQREIPTVPLGTRTVVVDPGIRTTIIQPSTRTVVVTGAKPTSSTNVRVPKTDTEAQAKALRAVREKEMELNGSRPLSLSDPGSADAQAKAMEALRQKQAELNSKNPGVWNMREAEAAANRRAAEDAARQARVSQESAFRNTQPPNNRTQADADAAQRARINAETSAQRPVAQPIRPVVSETAVTTPGTTISPNDPSAQARALEALRQREAELNRQNPKIESSVPKPVATQPLPNANATERALRPGERVDQEPTPGSVPTTRDEKLADLLRKYKADLITPREYHQERAKIIAEP